MKNQILKLIGRNECLFDEDLNSFEDKISLEIQNSRFLVIGGAGTIGQATTKEIFKRNPATLHIVDISENNLVELVRDLRSTIGYGQGEFKTFAIDCGSEEFEIFINNEGPYDYVFNLSALKHVRSEKDPYSLMRMIKVNIFNTINTLRYTKEIGCKKYFCVSTDKAANPINMMGASKKIMEMFLMRESLNQKVSMARFANVAFSDGSLLHGFNNRFSKKQPFSAPNDVKRYFVTPQESGELCLLSGLLGNNREIFFPKLSEKLHLIKFSNIAKKYIRQQGYEPFECSSEEQARIEADELIKNNLWPCYFFKSDTTGEKDFEEFYTDLEDLNLSRFKTIGVIKNDAVFDENNLLHFENEITSMMEERSLKKELIVNLFSTLLDDFSHEEKGKNLDQKM